MITEFDVHKKCYKSAWHCASSFSGLSSYAGRCGLKAQCRGPGPAWVSTRTGNVGTAHYRPQVLHSSSPVCSYRSIATGICPVPPAELEIPAPRALGQEMGPPLGLSLQLGLSLGLSLGLPLGLSLGLSMGQPGLGLQMAASAYLFVALIEA